MTRITGMSLSLQQAGALFSKRFNHYRRNWRLFLTGILLPLLGLLIAMGFSSVKPDELDLKQLVLDPAIYGPDIYNFHQDIAYTSESYRYSQVLKNTSVGAGSTCLLDEVDDWLGKYGGDTYDGCSEGTSWYNKTMPMNLQVCKNARQVHRFMGTYYSIPEKKTPSGQFLQNLNTQKISPYIMRTFKDYKDERFGGWSFEKSEDPATPLAVDPFVWYNTKGYHAMPSYLNTMSNTILRSLLPADKHQEEYGITTLNHPMRFGRPALTVKSLNADAADAGVAILVVVAFSFVPCGFILYLISERVQKQRQLQNISGVGMLTYWMVSFTWDMLIYSVAVGLAVVIACIFQMDSYYLKDNLAAFAVILMLYGWSIIPCCYCLVRAFSRGSTAFLVIFCINLFIALITVISLLVMQLFKNSYHVWEAYKVCKYIFLVFPQYCLGQGLMDMVSSMFAYKLFLRFDEERYTSPFNMDIIGWHLISLGIQGVFFFVLAIVIDSISTPAVSITNKLSTKYITADEDEDVTKERERVEQGNASDMLVVDGLSKVYRRGLKKFLAVDHISFVVPEGESFGLLGTNGAGKTTTFRMLTGDLGPASGAATLKGKVLSPNDRSFGQDVGYCPQEGGLDNYLTAHETLTFHAKLRGFNRQQTEQLVPDLLAQLQLTPYAHKAVHTYSGGTQRKLSLAVALLGNPPILYLDEPTTGMDAGTRRLAWACILKANNRGQSVVLTSHSMDECNALCAKIAIMVNGTIKCIGSPQHLKNRFGDGYTVIMHMSEDDGQNMTHFFLQRFPGSVIKATHHSRVEMQVPQDSARVADIIAVLQKAQQDHLIEYYSLSQTTLDSVFISFAANQRESDSTNASTYESNSQSGSLSSSSSPNSSDIPPKAKDVFVNPTFIPDDPRPQPSAPHDGASSLTIAPTDESNFTNL